MRLDHHFFRAANAAQGAFEATEEKRKPCEINQPEPRSRIKKRGRVRGKPAKQNHWRGKQPAQRFGATLPVQLPFFWTGDHGEDETPVPIPNTTVKGLSGDDTASQSAGK